MANPSHGSWASHDANSGSTASGETCSETAPSTSRMGERITEISTNPASVNPSLWRLRVLLFVSVFPSRADMATTKPRLASQCCIVHAIKKSIGSTTNADTPSKPKPPR